MTFSVPIVPTMSLKHLSEVLVKDHELKHPIDSGTFPESRTLQECCVTLNDKECQLYLVSVSSPCQGVSNAMLYILHFVFQIPCSAFIVPSHEFWT